MERAGPTAAFGRPIEPQGGLRWGEPAEEGSSEDGQLLTNTNAEVARHDTS